MRYRRDLDPDSYLDKHKAEVSEASLDVGLALSQISYSAAKVLVLESAYKTMAGLVEEFLHQPLRPNDNHNEAYVNLTSLIGELHKDIWRQPNEQFDYLALIPGNAPPYIPFNSLSSALADDPTLVGPERKQEIIAKLNKSKGEITQLRQDAGIKTSDLPLDKDWAGKLQEATRPLEGTKITRSDKHVVQLGINASSISIDYMGSKSLGGIEAKVTAYLAKKYKQEHFVGDIAENLKLGKSKWVDIRVRIQKANKSVTDAIGAVNEKAEAFTGKQADFILKVGDTSYQINPKYKIISDK